MKVNSIIVAVILLLVAFPLHAQWSIGGVFDINLASISVDPEPSTEQYSGRVGFGLGVVLDRSLSGQIDLHVEPMFLQKGAKIKEAGDDITFNISYLELPIMFRYNFQTDSSIRPYVMAGPSLGLLLSAKYSSKDGREQDAKDELKKMDLGVGFGGGVNISLDRMTLFVEARYVLGLSNINDESDESTVKNRGLQVVVGATVPLGK